MRFHELNLSPDLMRGIEDADFTECTPVQDQTFKLALDEGRDVTVQSQTGTGKTAAFLISIFEIFERSARAGEGSPRHAALVVVPTRELAVQVADEAKILGKHLSYRIGSVFGGVGYGQQERLLEQGADILIGTPGRLLDFSSSRKLDLRGFDILVLDEADRMLDMGFLPDVKRILRALPPATERKTMLFSATLGTRVKHLAWEYMNNPGEIEVAPERVTVDEITQELYHVTRKEKVSLLLGLLEREKPENALIFTNMKSTAVELAKRLSYNGLPTEYIMGDLPQRKRLHLIEGIKEGTIKLLVATDVAARGLHIDDLDLVVNFDIPEDFELYVHRIGRTARAGKSGKAITLACERYVYGLEAIESFIGQKIPVLWPEESLFKADAAASMSFAERRGFGAGDRDRRSNRRSGRPSANRDRSSGRSSGASRRPHASQERPPAGTRGEGERNGATGKPVAGESRAGAGQPRAAADQSRANGSQSKAAGNRPKGSPRQRPAQRQPVSRAPGATSVEKPAANASIEDRLSYYKKKYGEDFAINREKSDEARPAPKKTQRQPAQRQPDKNQPAQRQASQRKPAQHQPAQRQAEQRKPAQRQQAQRQPERQPNNVKPKGGDSAHTPPQPDGLISKLKGLFKRR